MEHLGELMESEELYIHRQTHTKQNSWWLNDAKGIPISRVCGECEEKVKDGYNPAIFGEYGNYEDVVDEQIEPEEDY